MIHQQANTIQEKGNLFIVAAPSGGGKTSLVKRLALSLSNIVISISHTTRYPRPAEKESVDYFFVNELQFKEMIEQDAFVEHAMVFGAHYGTSAAQINDRLHAGTDVVLDIDWQGAAQIKARFPEAVTIFILPPSLDVLKERLCNRRQDSPAVIAHRMQEAQDELSHFKAFDYLIVNDDFEQAAKELQAIVIANRLISARQMGKNEKLLSLLVASQ